MATQIKKSNGDVLVTIPNGDIDTDETSLALIAEGAEDWIVAMNQNWVRSLENFAHYAPPSNPMVGQFWFDTTIRTVKVWDGLEWVMITGTAVASEEDAESDLTAGEGGDIDQAVIDAIDAAKADLEAMLAEGQRLYEDRERLAAEARADGEALLQENQAFLSDRIDNAFAQLSLIDPEAGTIGDRVIQHSNAIAGQALLIEAVESVTLAAIDQFEAMEADRIRADR